MMIDMICIFLHNGKELLLAGSFIVGNRRFHHMACTVKLMPLQQIRPALVPVLNGIVGVEIPVLVLGCGNFIHQLVYLSLQLFIWEIYKTVGGRFDPFCSVTVLKDHSVKAVSYVLSTHCLCRIFKIRHHMAFLHAFYAVMQNGILIRDHGIPDQFLIMADKALCALKVFDIDL